MSIDWNGFTHTLLATLIYCIIGIVMFGLSFLIIKSLVPFSIRKEIEEDQNIALGIVIGCVILGLSIIIAAAVGT